MHVQLQHVPTNTVETFVSIILYQIKCVFISSTERLSFFAINQTKEIFFPVDVVGVRQQSDQATIVLIK